MSSWLPHELIKYTCSSRVAASGTPSLAWRGRRLLEFCSVVWSARKTNKPTIHLCHLVIKGHASRVPEARCLVVDRMRLSSDVLDLLYDLENTFSPLPLRSTTRFSHRPQGGKRKETHGGINAVGELDVPSSHPWPSCQSLRLPRRAVETHHFFVLHFLLLFMLSRFLETCFTVVDFDTLYTSFRFRLSFSAGLPASCVL